MLNELVGRTIAGIKIDDSLQEYLVFETTEGNIIYRGYGDCCSESYFADIVGVENLLYQKVLGVKDVELEEGEPKPHKSRQDSDSVYGVDVTTEKGTCLVVLINS